MNAIKKDDPSSTEEKIRQAAKKVFLQKGYAGTRTRDIAEEAGINLALLNYYFRTKEKLFEQVMKVKIVLLFGQIIPIVTNEKTTLEEKIDLASVKYFDILTKNPNLPIFVLSEIQKKTSDVKSILPFEKVLNNSFLMQQIREKQPDQNPFHFLLNYLSMTVFPFLGKPILQSFDLMDDDEFQKFVTERKTLVPMWIKMMLNN